MRFHRVNYFIILLALFYGCEPAAQPNNNPYQNPYQTNTPPADPAPGPATPVLPTTPQPAPETPVPSPAPVTPAPSPTTTPKPMVVTPAPAPRPDRQPIRVRMDLVPVGNVVRTIPVKSSSQGNRDVSVQWSVKPDPLRSDLRFGDSAVAGIGIPSGSEKDVRVLFSTSPGPCVALGVSDGSSLREVWDLRQKTKIGEISGLSLGGSPFQVLSADGKFFAAHPAGSSVVGVFDVAAGKPHNVLDIDLGRMQYLGFAGTDRLVYVKDDVLHSWDIPAWKEMSQKSTPYISKAGQWGASAGGNFLLFANEDQGTTYCNLIDSKTGNLQGRVKVGTAVQRLGASFSHDGNSFAVLFTQGPVSNLQIWDMASGSIQSEEKILEPIADMKESPGCDVTWFPDGSKVLLFGRAVFDIQAGKLARVLTHESTEPVRAVTGNQVAVAQGDRLELISIDGTAGPSAPSKATLQAALTSGESFDDSVLPPLSSPDRSAVNEVPLEADRRAWDYIPRRAKYFSKKVTSKPVSIPAGQIYKACLSNGDWPYAAILYSNTLLSPTRTIRPQSEEPQNRIWIEWFELRSGIKKQTFDLPFATCLEDIDQEAELIVTRIENGLDRLDFWSLKEGAHKYGFRPYRTAENPTGAAVDFVQFVNNDKNLLTLGGGKLTLWEIPACRAVWEVPVGQLQPVISPALESVVVSSSDDQKVCFIDLATGKTTGALKSGSQKGQPVTAVAFSPDGQNLIMFTERGDGSRVVVQDLALNKELHHFALPVAAHVADWVDDGYVLIDGKSLLKIKDYAIGWTYKLPAGMNVLDSPDGRYWYLSAEGDEFALAGVVLPDLAAKNTLESKSVVTEILLSPGENVSINNRVDSLHANLMQPLEQHLKQSLEANGYHVSSNQPSEISIQAIQEPTGRDLEGKLIGELPGTLRAPDIRISEEILTLQVTLSKKGNVLWQKEFQVENSGHFEFVLDTPPKEIQAIANATRSEAMWESVLQDSLKITLPEIIFANGAERGIGESTLSIKGIR